MIDALGNLHGFFNTLNTNMNTVEGRKLFPIQANLITRDEDKGLRDPRLIPMVKIVSNYLIKILFYIFYLNHRLDLINHQNIFEHLQTVCQVS